MESVTPEMYLIRMASLPVVQLEIPNRAISPLKTTPMQHSPQTTEAFWNKKLADLENSD